jgi:hypothetical protein
MRRLITFMVVKGGFSLLELRKLYMDELFEFYNELIFNLESLGEMKEGTYNKLMTRAGNNDAKSVVDSLRKQLFRGIAGKSTKA